MSCFYVVKNGSMYLRGWSDLVTPVWTKHQTRAHRYTRDQAVATVRSDDWDVVRVKARRAHR